MKLFLCSLCVVVVVAAAAPASAQTARPERPYRGLFGSGVGDAQQLLSVNGSLGSGWDTNILADASGREIEERGRQAGTVVSGSGSASYSLQLSRLSVSGSGGTSARYYPDRPDDITRTYNASLGLSSRVFNSLTLSQTASYQPVSFSSLFPVFTEPVSGGDAMLEFEVVPVREHYVSYAGGAVFNTELSSRTNLSANYGYRKTEGLVGREFLTQGAGSTLQFEMTRYLALRLGYGYSEGRYDGAADTARNHSADVGVDYNRALSFSRRTTLSFGTGSAATVHSGETRYRVTGNLRLNHELGRTWNVSVAYNRGLRFVEVFRQPVFSDAATATFGGLISRRLQFQATARTAFGSVGGGGGNDFNSYRGSASLSMAVSRNISLGLDYSYYRNTFGGGVVLPPGFARNMDRQSVRASVSVWAPLFYQRSSNAAR